MLDGHGASCARVLAAQSVIIHPAGRQQRGQHNPQAPARHDALAGMHACMGSGLWRQQVHTQNQTVQASQPAIKVVCLCTLTNGHTTPMTSPALVSIWVVVAELLQWVASNLVVLVCHLLVGSSSTQLLNIVPAAAKSQHSRNAAHSDVVG